VKHQSVNRRVPDQGTLTQTKPVHDKSESDIERQDCGRQPVRLLWIGDSRSGRNGFPGLTVRACRCGTASTVLSHRTLSPNLAIHAEAGRVRKSHFLHNRPGSWIVFSADWLKREDYCAEVSLAGDGLPSDRDESVPNISRVAPSERSGVC
jgi:hypothetical protein